MHFEQSHFRLVPRYGIQLIFTLLAVLCLACSNDDDGTQGELPPLTSAGLNTFGCFIDGELFLPREAGPNIGDPTDKVSASYTYNPSMPEGTTYEFIIFADNEITGKNLRIASLRSDGPLEEGRTYPIVELGENNFWATYNFWTGEITESNEIVAYFYETTMVYTGSVTITRLDEAARIIAGTFEFSAYDDNFELVSEITDGRFDLLYRTN